LQLKLYVFEAKQAGKMAAMLKVAIFGALAALMKHTLAMKTAALSLELAGTAPANTCNCPNGVAATGAACTSDGAVVCTSCISNYELDDSSNACAVAEHLAEHFQITIGSCSGGSAVWTSGLPYKRIGTLTRADCSLKCQETYGCNAFEQKVSSNLQERCTLYKEDYTGNGVAGVQCMVRKEAVNSDNPPAAPETRPLKSGDPYSPGTGLYNKDTAPGNVWFTNAVDACTYCAEVCPWVGDNRKTRFESSIVYREPDQPNRTMKTCSAKPEHLDLPVWPVFEDDFVMLKECIDALDQPDAAKPWDGFGECADETDACPGGNNGDARSAIQVAAITAGCRKTCGLCEVKPMPPMKPPCSCMAYPEDPTAANVEFGRFRMFCGNDPASKNAIMSPYISDHGSCLCGSNDAGYTDKCTPMPWFNDPCVGVDPVTSKACREKNHGDTTTYTTTQGPSAPPPPLVVVGGGKTVTGCQSLTGVTIDGYLYSGDGIFGWSQSEKFLALYNAARGDESAVNYYRQYDISNFSEECASICSQDANCSGISFYPEVGKQTGHTCWTFRGDAIAAVSKAGLAGNSTEGGGIRSISCQKVPAQVDGGGAAEAATCGSYTCPTSSKQVANAANFAGQTVGVCCEAAPTGGSCGGKPYRPGANLDEEDATVWLIAKSGDAANGVRFADAITEAQKTALATIGDPGAVSIQPLCNGENYVFSFSSGWRVKVFEDDWNDPRFTVMEIETPGSGGNEGTPTR